MTPRKAKKTSRKPAVDQASTTPARRTAARSVEYVEADALLRPAAASDDPNERITSLTQTNRQLKRKIFDLYTIFEISRNFNAVLDYKMLLDTFILTSLAQVGASRAAIFLKEDRLSEHLVLVEKRGSGSFPLAGQSFKTTSRLGQYLSKLNRPVRTDDILSDLSDRDERGILERFHPGLVVPLIYQTSLRGVFIITDKMSRREFSMDDIEFLSILGNQISVAIENARLYEAEKMATQQLRSAQEQLVQAERLAALGEMSAKVAHEVNNPLGIIKNYLTLIKRSVANSADTEGYTDIVSQEIDRIARIVRELLDFHRPSGLVFEPVDMPDVLDHVLLLMDRKLESCGVELTRKYAPRAPRVTASVESLKQVFINLIINACDAMRPDGGSLVIEVAPDNGMLAIRFRDTGPGIKPEHIPHIFEPFFTTKAPGEGTGLGLSVCYGIIKKHQGTITYANAHHGGLFEIRLPLSRGDDQSDPNR